MSKGPKRPGEELLQELKFLSGKEVELHLISGSTIPFRVIGADVEKGLIRGWRTVTNEKTHYRVSCIMGFTEKD